MSKTTETRSKVCLPECEGHEPFSLDAGDRARATFEKAAELAAEREARRGPQTVNKHISRIFPRGVWFVQDVRA